jgi:hypothetical protein
VPLADVLREEFERQDRERKQRELAAQAKKEAMAPADAPKRAAGGPPSFLPKVAPAPPSFLPGAPGPSPIAKAGRIVQGLRQMAN